VAASKHFPAGDKLAIPHTFSSGGSAAIEPICSLGAGFFRKYFIFKFLHKTSFLDNQK
jgi:hypothetical protein